jgi:S-(hydroxymethyl)glutathione dehydrogenase/alcohol dehydrogenase
MKTRAAVLRKGGTPWEVTELDLDGPKVNEVLIQMEAAGLCHSDEHIRARGFARLPMVGGHEGAGVVVAAEYAVMSEFSCVKIEDYVPMELAALVSCGVTTGFCSAIYAGDVRVGDTAVVFGTGGVGMNAVQGAAYAGAKYVFAIDPNEWKLERAKEFGATHAFSDPVKAKEVLIDLTRGQLADKVICTVGEMDNEVVKAAVDMTGKAGTIVITGVGYYDMVLPGGILIGYHRRMQGSLFGGANPLYDIPMILSLWHEGRIKLDELITKRYTLDEINEGYQDLMDGKNIRGVIVHQH